MAVKFAGFNLDSPLIMGIVNVTPDSFSDGGETFKTSDAISRAIKYIDSGANIIDVGGQSTKPQSQPISVRQELNMPRGDEGIDLIAETREGEYCSIQAKFRTDTDRAFTSSDLDRFIKNSFRISKNISFALFLKYFSKKIKNLRF